jgi:hypothetical protein
MEDGRLGTLANPRGCYCGANGEACWDIALDEGGGIQAHGGTFRAEGPRVVDGSSSCPECFHERGEHQPTPHGWMCRHATGPQSLEGTIPICGCKCSSWVVME